MIHGLDEQRLVDVAGRSQGDAGGGFKTRR